MGRHVQNDHAPDSFLRRLLRRWGFSRAGDYGVRTLWERNNVGKRYEDISILGQRPTDE